MENLIFRYLKFFWLDRWCGSLTDSFSIWLLLFGCSKILEVSLKTIIEPSLQIQPWSSLAMYSPMYSNCFEDFCSFIYVFARRNGNDQSWIVGIASQKKKSHTMKWHISPLWYVTVLKKYLSNVFLLPISNIYYIKSKDIRYCQGTSADMPPSHTTKKAVVAATW